jgi:hypothetical protein
MTGLRPWAYAGLAVVLFGLGWLVNGWRLASELSHLEASQARAVATAADATLTLQHERDAQAAATRGKLAAVGTDAAAQSTKDQNDKDRVNSCLRDGSCVLRIRAQCPAGTSNVPSAGAGGSVDTAAPAVLAPEAGQAYQSLRAGILETERVLKTCQRSLAVLTGQSTP